MAHALGVNVSVGGGANELKRYICRQMGAEAAKNTFINSITI